MGASPCGPRVRYGKKRKRSSRDARRKEFRMESTSLDPILESRVRASFARQRVMKTIGAQMTHVEAGSVEITLPYRWELTQQNGFLHAGIVATILDSACGYAAFSLMPADKAVLTVEYKINLLRPA